MRPNDSAFEALRARDFRRACALIRADPAEAHRRDASGMSLLLLAIYFRARDVVDAVREAGVEPDAFEAAALGDVARLRILVRAEAALLEARNVDGATALHLAAHFGHEDAVTTLLRLGADVSGLAGPPLGNTALHAAVAGGHSGLVDVLVNAGAAVDARDVNGYAPLHVAAANGDTASVRALLARKADPEAPGANGVTAAALARERGHEAVAALIEA